MNRDNLKNIIKRINTLWFTKYSETFFDVEDRSELFSFVKDINQIDGVSDVILGDRESVKYFDLDRDANFMYSHKIIIKINNIKLTGCINLICKDGNDYNMVLCLNNNPILESYKPLNEKLQFKSFLNELAQCENFDEIKQVFKKYLKEGIIAGTLITAILCNFDLSDQQIYELGYYGYYGYYNSDNIDDTEYIEDMEPFYDYTEDAEWELLCTDAEITVYHAKESQCNADVQHTASMFKLDLTDPESHKIVAMERTMMKQYGLHYGDLIKIEGTDSRDDVYQIQDTMNKRFKGKHKIDILINNDSELGIWNNVKVYKLSNPESCYDSFKENMADALNQSSIDKRQSRF